MAFCEVLLTRKVLRVQKSMKIDRQTITFKRLDKRDNIPYELLLLADPSKDIVDRYLKQSDLFIATQNDEILGVVVLFQLSAAMVEIKNIAVKEEYQGQGIGTYLIENILRVATANGQKSISIGTANSSLGQLYLYQKLGFDITDIKRDFFTRNYTEPIYENGIQAKHLLVLTRKLKDE